MPWNLGLFDFILNLPLVFEYVFLYGFLSRSFHTKHTEAYAHGQEKDESELAQDISSSHSMHSIWILLTGLPGQSGWRFSPEVTLSKSLLASPFFCLQIRGTGKSTGRELHIAYRYGEHYDSVRRINDNSEAPAHLQTDVSDAPLSFCSPASEEPGWELGAWSWKPAMVVWNIAFKNLWAWFFFIF